MKKIIFSLFVMVALVPAISFAAPVPPAGCTIPPDHAIWSEDSTKIVSCIKDTDWQNALKLQINQNDKNDFINVLKGQRLMTTYGFEDTCPTWFPMNCVIKKSIFLRWL